MVTVTVPVVAVLLAVSVKVLLLVVGLVGLGLNAAVTPLGRVEVDMVTLPLKPFCGVTVIVLCPLPPWFIVTLLGEADRELVRASCRGLAVNVSVVVFVRLPEVPVMVTVTVPVVAVLLAVSVKVLLLVVGLVGLGLNAAVTPLRRVEVDMVTLPIKPFCGVTVIVLCPLPPWFIVTLLGEADR